MLLAFVIIIMVLLHVDFFVRHLLFGTDEANFFGFTIRYLFDQQVAAASLAFSLSCIVAFSFCYLVAARLARPVAPRLNAVGEHPVYVLPLWPLVLAGLMQIVAALVIVIQSGFVYQVIAESLEQAGFLLELRVVFLLLLAHLLLNVRLGDVLTMRAYRAVRIIVVLYIIALLLMQARSRVFEVAAVLAFTQLMWQGDQVRLRYFLWVGLALITPNLIVLGRLGWPDDFSTLIQGIFSFEYTVLFNNLLSAAIEAGPNEHEPYTFMPSLSLLLPSPVRSLFGMEVVKSDYYQELAEAANIRNGGFSLLAELFTNFGWNAVVVLGAMGALMGWINARARQVGHASMLVSMAPLFYTAFILAFRNDLGVFIKYVVQLFLIAMTMNILIFLAMALQRRPRPS